MMRRPQRGEAVHEANDLVGIDVGDCRRGEYVRLTERRTEARPADDLHWVRGSRQDGRDVHAHTCDGWRRDEKTGRRDGEDDTERAHPLRHRSQDRPAQRSQGHSHGADDDGEEAEDDGDQDDGHIAEDGVDNLSVSTPLGTSAKNPMAATVRCTVACVALISALLQLGGSARQLSPGGIDVELFFRVTVLDDRVADEALARIADAWK